MSSAPKPPDPLRRTAKDALLSPLGILALSLAFFFAAALLCFGLAFEWISGYPKSAEKNVAIYYQSSPSPTDLAVYLHPPVNSVQAEGHQGQLLAMQFTNRGASSINIRSLQLFSAGCFRMERQGADATTSATTKPSANTSTEPPLLTLNAYQSVLLWYRLLPLEDLHNCPGQSPLVFLYTWQQASTPIQPLLEQQSISTGPVRLTTLRDLHYERFLSLLGKIVPLILLPVVLAIGNYLLQDLQRRRTDDQKVKDDAREAAEKRQEQKLEVWKTMILSMVEAIRDHYVPIVRVLLILEQEAAQIHAPADLNDILACVLLFRTKITHLVDQNGGFYFRNHRGEDLCATLSNDLSDRCYTLSGDRQAFLKCAEKLQPVNSLTQARQTMGIDDPLPGEFAQLYYRFRQQLTQPGVLDSLSKHASLLREILEHEINDPFYPFWYETTPKPLEIDVLRSYATQLNLSREETEEIREQLDEYIKSLDAKPDATHS